MNRKRECLKGWVNELITTGRKEITKKNHRKRLYALYGLNGEIHQLAYEVRHFFRKPSLDLFLFLPIIGRNTYSLMNSIFSLSLIVVILAVLIIKDLFVVRMAKVRVKK
jgi:hypothetical protein